MQAANPYHDDLERRGCLPFPQFHFQSKHVIDRTDLVRHYAWAIPNESALDVLARHAPIIEIGAGAGYWAWCLRQRQVDILAFDLDPTVANHQMRREPWTAVHRGGARITGYHADRTLFLCWPPYHKRMAFNALRSYRGDTLVYVGEGLGGCCADDAFFGRVEREWIEIREVSVPQWTGLHDSMSVFTRRKAVA